MTVTDQQPPAVAADAAGLERLNRLLDGGIRVIRVVHTDLFGRQRSKQYPASAIASVLGGVAYSKMSIAEDLLGVPVAEDAFPQLAGHPDLIALVDPGCSFVPPWEPDSVWVLSRLSEHGAPSPLCPRSALTRAQQRFSDELGLAAVAAGEPEFYLFRRDEKGGRHPYAQDGVSYTMDRITDPDGAVGRMHRALIDFGIGVSVVNREFSPGQFEINLTHGPVEQAADEAFLLKSAVKELAMLEGLDANFMAKPMTEHEGSSLHVHVSLWDESGANVFASEDGGVSERCLSALAGIQAHASAIMAFAAPTVNSYKRLTGNGLSPRSSNWAEDNRFSFLRVPAERGGATRIELRAGDASASPHLLMAAMLHAMRDGIARELTPIPAGSALPRSLGESVEALEADEVFTEAFGSELVDVYVALKRAELDAYASTVTDWEWSTYRKHV